MLQDIADAAVLEVIALSPMIVAIGGAVITLAVAALGIRWIKATFF